MKCGGLFHPKIKSVSTSRNNFNNNAENVMLNASILSSFKELEYVYWTLALICIQCIDQKMNIQPPTPLTWVPCPAFLPRHFSFGGNWATFHREVSRGHWQMEGREKWMERVKGKLCWHLDSFIIDSALTDSVPSKIFPSPAPALK